MSSEGAKSSDKAGISSAIAEGQELSWWHRLDLRIRDLGWKNAELERRSGVSSKRIGEYRAGKAEPSASSMARMAEALGVSVEYLMTGEQPLGASFGSAAAAGAARASQLAEREGRPFDPVLRPRPVPGKGEPSAYDRAAIVLDQAIRIAGWEPPEDLRVALMNILVAHDIRVDQVADLIAAAAPPE